MDRRDSEVKLHLNIDKNQEKQHACWLPFASQGNNIFYCMPELGENASLCCQNGEESSCIVSDVVRGNGSSCAKTSDPSVKYLGIPTGQEFFMSKNKLDFVEREGQFLSLEKGVGIIGRSIKDIIIRAKGNINITARKEVLLNAKNGSALIGAGRDGSKSQIYMEGGPAGDLHISTEGQLKQDGRARKLLTDRINRDVSFQEAPEKKFSWLKLAGCILAGLAVVALVVVTAGAAAVVLGASATLVGAVMGGAAISGVITVATMAVGDIIRGENSSVEDFMSGAFRGAVEGAVSGAVLFLRHLLMR